MSSLQKQLHQAWVASGLTLDQLSAKAGLHMTKVSMSRKLRGLQKMTTQECEALSKVLRVQVAFGREARA